MIKILFICLGNICRSPAAEAVMNAMLKENKINQFVQCDSAGVTTTFLGKPADAMMIQAANERGYQVDSIARPILERDFEQFDMILAMTNEITAELKLYAPNETIAQKIQNFCDYCEYHSEDDVPDPFQGDEEEFEFVLDMIEDACRGLLKAVKNKIN